MAKQQEEPNSNVELTAKFNRWFSSAQASRKEIDWQWFLYDLWVSGNHYAKWDKSTQMVVGGKKTDGKPKVTINKVYITLRAVRNYALRNRPRAEVTPVDLTEDNVDEAIKLNRYLDFLHDKLGLSAQLKATVWHALKYSVGYWQVLWDEDANDGEGEIAVHVIDPYDLYWDRNARTPSEARYVVLAVRRNIEDLKNDSKYIKEEVEALQGDRLLAASSVKSRLISAERGDVYDGRDDGTVIVKEIWYKERQPDGKFKVMIAALGGERLIRQPEDTGLNQLPFFRLCSDVEPLQMFGQGWVKNLIPVNRLLNRLESQVAEWNDIMNKGKWIADKGAGVRIINNENGQIIEKKRGYDVTQGAIVPLSAAIFKQIDNCNRYLEDIGGAHDASLGRIPTGASAGKAIEALQVGDSNNLSEIVENVEIFLEDVYEYILYLASQKYQFARNIIPLTKSGAREFITVIGEDAPAVQEGQTLDNAVVIRKKNMVDVKISSWIAQTAEARRDALKELYTLKAIDAQTLLEGYNIGNIADIIKRLRDQRKEEMAMQAQQAQMANQAPQSGQQQAIAAIRSLLMGQQPPMPQAITPEFVNYIDQFMESQKLDPASLQALQAFRDQVVQMLPPQGNSSAPPMGQNMM